MAAAAPPTPRLHRLKQRFLFAFLGVSLVPLALVAAWSLVTASRTVSALARDSLLDECTLAAVEFEKAVNAARSDLAYLSQLSSLRVLVDEAATDRAAAVSLLGGDLARALAPWQQYAGARYVDESGDEVARVLRAKEAIQIVPRQGLRHVGFDPFFRQGSSLSGGQVFVGVLDVEEPDQPAGGAVVRFLVNTYDNQARRRGALVLDLRMEALLSDIRRKGVTAEQLVVVDPRGAYVEHPQERRPNELPWKSDLRLRFPEVASASGHGAALRQAPDGAFVAIRSAEVGGSPVPWRVATIRPGAVVTRPLANARAIFAGVLLLALALAWVLARVTADRLSRPLLELAAHADELGRGRFDRTLDVRTGDEVEVLARALQRMATELQGLYRDLERRIAAKTAELTEANQQLIQAEKLSSIGRLAASVAHEINNPTGIISMYAQMLREETIDPAAREKIDRILDGAEKIGRTVRDLLDASRRAPTAPERVDVRGLLQGAIEQVRSLAGDAVPAIALAVEGEPAVLGEHGPLGQVFRNLVENAVQATGARGHVRLEASAGDGEVTIAVSDDGPGIAADVLARVFEPFFTTKRAGSGTGLGLFVAYSIVRSHGGSIGAESSPGAGSRFVVRLPRG